MVGTCGAGALRHMTLAAHVSSPPPPLLTQNQPCPTCRRHLRVPHPCRVRTTPLRTPPRVSRPPFPKRPPSTTRVVIWASLTAFDTTKGRPSLAARPARSAPRAAETPVRGGSAMGRRRSRCCAWRSIHAAPGFSITTDGAPAAAAALDSRAVEPEENHYASPFNDSLPGRSPRSAFAFWYLTRRGY